ncbi:MAG: hypothetical protein QNJ63_17895 [Calothrix sp. MO_192.B10]|nr:hypothetical protein [Calothrix sp. MO_192.B10]
MLDHVGLRSLTQPTSSALPSLIYQTLSLRKGNFPRRTFGLVMVVMVDGLNNR